MSIGKIVFNRLNENQYEKRIANIKDFINTTKQQQDTTKKTKPIDIKQIHIIDK